jgi:hypothetical protein
VVLVVLGLLVAAGQYRRTRRSTTVVRFAAAPTDRTLA